MPERPGRLPRVLFAVGGLQTGGSENQMLELITRAHGRHFDACLMTFGEPVPAREAQLAELGVLHVRVPPAAWLPRLFRPLVALPRVTREAHVLQPDLVYPWLEVAATTLAPVAAMLRIPLVIGRRNVSGAPIERRPPVRLLIRRAERSATLVTGNSNAVLAAAEVRGIKRDRLRLVRNGHPPRPALPLPGNGPVTIGYVANFRREKGHLRLLDALAHVSPSTPWRVDLAGSGVLHDDIAAEIAARGLDDRVRMVGPMTDPEDFWRTRHVAALLSDHEGSPNSLIEAAGFGRAMIGTDSGGTREVIPESAGLLVPLQPSTEIARAFERLIDDSDLRERLARGASVHASREYTMERFVTGHVSVIHEALDVLPRRSTLPRV